MLKGLEVYGVKADEGVIGEETETGNYGPYYQSARKDIYQTYAKNLVKQGLAYPCFCSADEIEEIRQQQEGEDIRDTTASMLNAATLHLSKSKKILKRVCLGL
jgi:glutamyl/glutaminyl-tRNA synthetase